MEITSFKDEIMKMECPFTWKLDEIPDRLSAADMLEKIEFNDESSEPWAQLCEKFSIAYLHYENKNYIEASKLLEECNDYLQSSDSSLLITYKKSFQSIYYASREFLASKSSAYVNLKESMDGIVSLSDLSDVEKSGIFAIKAALFMKFGLNGIQEAFSFAGDALKLNPNEGEWHYLMGDLLNRMRHIKKIFLPSSEEINYFQNAFSSSGSPKMAIVLAHVYMEKARHLTYQAQKSHSNLTYFNRNEVKDMYKKADSLIEFALEKNKGACVKTMIRCAYALARFPGHHRNIKRAIEVIEEALKISPSSGTGNRLAGDLCLKIAEPKYEKALMHYQIAATKKAIKAEFAIFEIERHLGRNPDPEAFYSRILRDFKEKYHQIMILTHACEFYIFITNDLFKALHYFMESLAIDPENSKLKAHYVKVIKKEISFYEVVANEARIALERELYKDATQETLLRNVLMNIKEHNPKLIEQTINYNLIKDLIDHKRPEDDKRSRREGDIRGGRRS